MWKTCIVDGVAFEAVRPQAKYCSPRCNKRAQRGNFGTPPLPPVAVQTGTGASPARPGENPFVAATRDELEEAGVLNTVTGQQVLLLAQQMCGRETAGGMTSLSKEFSRMRAEVLRTTAAAIADPVDELAKRRAEKMAAG